MTALGSVEGETLRPDAASNDVDEQPGGRKPASSGQPRDPLSTRAIATIAATLVTGLITVGGLAAIAACDTLRDDIRGLRTEFGEVHATLRDHTERLTRVETRQQDHTERFRHIEAQLQDHTELLQHHTERLTRVETRLQDHTERLTRIEAGQAR